jgi:hypothetical protein
MFKEQDHGGCGQHNKIALVIGLSETVRSETTVPCNIIFFLTASQPPGIGK